MAVYTAEESPWRLRY